MSRLAIESVLRKYYHPTEFCFIHETANVSDQAYVIKDDNGVLQRIPNDVTIDVFVFAIIYGDREHMDTWFYTYLFYYQDNIYCINFDTLSPNDFGEDEIIICPVGTSCVYSSKFFVSDDPCVTFVGRYNIDYDGWFHHEDKRYVSEFDDYSDDDRYADRTFIDDYSNYSDDWKDSECSDE